MGWQPIETAPKRGAEHFVFDPAEGAFVAFYSSKHGQWRWTTHDLDGDEIINPTRWWDFGDGKTMPEPPQ